MSSRVIRIRGIGDAVTRIMLVAILAGFVACNSFAQPAGRKTVVSIDGNAFRINGELTYKGRSFAGKRVEGLLLNSRMVQGIFDDLNPATRAMWKYPDGKEF